MTKQKPIHKNTLIVINGFSRSGKDLFVDCVRNVLEGFPENNVFCYNFHRSDAPKDMLKKNGWDGEKTPQVRKLLKELVDVLESNSWLLEDLKNKVKQLDHWLINYLTVKGEWTGTNLIFYHVRDPEAISKIQNDTYLNDICDVKSLYIIRDSLTATTCEEPDMWNMTNYLYDLIIHLGEGKEQVMQSAKDFCKSELMIG